MLASHKLYYVHTRYEKPTKRNCSVVQFRGNEFGEIQFYIHSMQSAFAVYKPLKAETSLLSSTRLQTIITRVKYSQQWKATLVTHILRKCVLVEFENFLYVVTIPNVYETD